MKISGSLFYRFDALTPCNVGSAYGEASLDRPTQKDAQFGLPFLPDSVIKGILAGRLGDAEIDGKPNTERERFWGSPDRNGTLGQRGPIVIRNAELLAFPVNVEGNPFWVFPAGYVIRLLQWFEATDSFGPAIDLLAGIELEGRPSRCWAWPRLPALDSLSDFEVLAGRRARLGAQQLGSLLSYWLRSGASERFLVVPVNSARELWVEAQQRRSSIRMDEETATASEGSLRTVELIPADTSFVSWVTCVGAVPQDVFPSTLQLGSGRNLGWGWFSMSPLLAPQDNGDRAWATERRQDERSPDTARIMIAMNQAIESLSGRGRRFRSKARSAIDNFGPRSKSGGLEAAVAFSLAKSKPFDSQAKTEAHAHRWLLATLLELELGGSDLEGTESLRRWLDQDPFEPGRLQQQCGEIMLRWLWLRRYAEWRLKGEEGDS